MKHYGWIVSGAVAAAGPVQAQAQEADPYFLGTLRIESSQAQALLGNLLFQSGKSVRGLAMMTAALERSQPSDRRWILKLQEEAFAVSPEADRRTAIALSEDIIRNNDR